MLEYFEFGPEGPRIKLLKKTKVCFFVVAGEGI